MNTETLSLNTKEQLEPRGTTLADLEAIIENAAAALTPHERAILENPNPTPPELRVAAQEASPEITFDGLLRKTPEIESPGRDHSMKLNIKKETDWAFKAW